VNANVTGVTVYVGNEFGGGTGTSTSATVSGLLEGTYTLKVTKEGYKDWTKQVTIAKSQTTTVYAYLEAGSGTSTTRSETIPPSYTFGALKVNANVTGVTVYVGNEFGGGTGTSTSATVSGLLEGTYTLKVTKDGYKDWTKQVTITKSQTTTVYAYLEAGSGTSTTRSETIPPSYSFGALKVNANVTGVTVYVGNEFGGGTGTSTSATVSGLLVGTYTLKVTKDGYDDWTAEVAISAGATTTVSAVLVLL